MKLYLIRHGESQNNAKGLYTGWAQVELTEKGIADAEGIRHLFEGIEFGKIYSSDLIRAKRTAETALPGCVYEENPLLRELNVGSLEMQPFFPKNAPERELIREGYADFGGESLEDFRVRIREFLRSLESSEEEYVAAFTHAGFLRHMLSIVLDAKTTHANLECSNCAVAILNFSRGAWQLSSWINPQ